MLSTASSSSTLLSALQAIAGGKKSGLTQGVSEEGASFGDLLSTLSGIAVSADKSGDPATAEEQALVPTVAGPAIAGGKILPGMLPDADADAELTETGDNAPAALTPEMMQLVLAGLPVPALPLAAETDAAEMPAAATKPALPTLSMPAPAGSETLAAPSQPTGKQDRRTAPAEVSLTVRVETPAAVEASVADPAEAATAAPAKAVATAAVRAETPVLQQLAPQFTAAPQEGAGSATPTHHVANHVASVHNPNSVDISATLDRLVAAREAFMPAQATLDIDHADFGEISIRFEQNTQGHLSVELAGSDPDLKRAVAAAVQTDSTTAGNQDNAASRSGTQQRDAQMDRGTGAGSGSEPRSQGERGAQGRRDDARQRDERAQSNPRSGTFA